MPRAVCSLPKQGLPTSSTEPRHKLRTRLDVHASRASACAAHRSHCTGAALRMGRQGHAQTARAAESPEQVSPEV